MMRFLTYLGLLSATLLWLGILWAFAQDPRDDLRCRLPCCVCSGTYASFRLFPPRIGTLIPLACSGSRSAECFGNSSA